MRTIWVLENIKKDFNFYQRFNILNLISSVSLWKKFHPNDHLELYCDKMTYDLLAYMDVLNLWNSVYGDNFKDIKINKSVFWAASKIEILNTIQEPVTIIDNDWLPFQNFDTERSLSDVVYSYDENGIDYYLTERHEFVTSLKNTKLFTMTHEAANVSFLSFNNTEILKKYTDLSIQLMKEWSDMKIKDNRLIIYAEQKILKQLLIKENVSHRPLVKNIWLCKADDWSKNLSENGFWLNTELWNKFKHYGPTKRKYKDNKPGYDYNKELEFMYNSINSTRLIDIDMLKNKIKIINNL